MGPTRTRARKWETLRLECSPPTTANQVQSPTGSLPEIFKWESYRTMSLVGRFSRGSSVLPPFYFGAAPFSPHLTLIGCQDVGEGVGRKRLCWREGKRRPSGEGKRSRQGQVTVGDRVFLFLFVFLQQPATAKSYLSFGEERERWEKKPITEGKKDPTGAESRKIFMRREIHSRTGGMRRAYETSRGQWKRYHDTAARRTKPPLVAARFNCGKCIDGRPNVRIAANYGAKDRGYALAFISGIDFAIYDDKRARAGRKKRRIGFRGAKTHLDSEDGVGVPGIPRIPTLAPGGQQPPACNRGQHWLADSEHTPGTVFAPFNLFEIIPARLLRALCLAGWKGIFLVRGLTPRGGYGRHGHGVLQTLKRNTMSAYTRQKAKLYRNRIRLERASRKQSSDTHKTPYDRVKRCRELLFSIRSYRKAWAAAVTRAAELLHFKQVQLLKGLHYLRTSSVRSFHKLFRTTISAALLLAASKQDNSVKLCVEGFCTDGTRRLTPGLRGTFAEYPRAIGETKAAPLYPGDASALYEGAFPALREREENDAKRGGGENSPAIPLANLHFCYYSFSETPTHSRRRGVVHLSAYNFNKASGNSGVVMNGLCAIQRTDLGRAHSCPSNPSVQRSRDLQLVERQLPFLPVHQSNIDYLVTLEFCRTEVLTDDGLLGATVAERLACSPPTKANRAQSLAGLPDFRKWESDASSTARLHAPDQCFARRGDERVDEHVSIAPSTPQVLGPQTCNIPSTRQQQCLNGGDACCRIGRGVATHRVEGRGLAAVSMVTSASTPPPPSHSNKTSPAAGSSLECPSARDLKPQCRHYIRRILQKNQDPKKPSNDYFLENCNGIFNKMPQTDKAATTGRYSTRFATQIAAVARYRASVVGDSFCQVIGFPKAE
ncbi:hypothetical protein PR048_028917 [Dryococelus australis]|uniref:Uncharacterized protein n=1 Tax=Dryococelus australis TaxID=614101 RepID=A0ABQ9GEM7_9NEOP|nr:hypothetical protein PR048_028917 [Dryococelus australis]